MEYKQPLMIANETLIGTLMKTEILTNNYTINYTENSTENCPQLMISLSHPSPVGTNGRCSAIVEGKQRAN